MRTLGSGILPFLSSLPPRSDSDLIFSLLAPPPRTETVPGLRQVCLVGNHLPIGLWAPWGSPYPPWSPQLWVSEDSPFLPLFPCLAWGDGASVVSLDSWTLSVSGRMGRPRGAGTEAVGFFPGRGLGFEALPPIQPRGKFGREAAPGGFPHPPHRCHGHSSCTKGSCPATNSFTWLPGFVC